MGPDLDGHGGCLLFLRRFPDVHRLAMAPVILASPIVATYPLIAMILAQIFLQRLERVTLRMVLGAILVAVGISFVVLGRAG